MAVPLKVARQQTTPKPSETLKLSASPEPSGTFGTCLRNLHQHTSESSGTFRKLPPELTPPHTGTFQNLSEPASGTYTSTHRNPPEPSGTCLRNLHQHTPEPCGNYTSTPEPSGTCLRNLHQHTPEPCGTFQNLPEPAPATRTGTHRSLSGLKTPLAYADGEKNPFLRLSCRGSGAVQPIHFSGSVKASPFLRQLSVAVDLEYIFNKKTIS